MEAKRSLELDALEHEHIGMFTSRFRVRSNISQFSILHCYGYLIIIGFLIMTPTPALSRPYEMPLIIRLAS